jgi:hypothetical protein
VRLAHVPVDLKPLVNQLVEFRHAHVDRELMQTLFPYRHDDGLGYPSIPWESVSAPNMPIAGNSFTLAEWTPIYTLLFSPAKLDASATFASGTHIHMSENGLFLHVTPPTANEALTFLVSSAPERFYPHDNDTKDVIELREFSSHMAQFLRTQQDAYRRVSRLQHATEDEHANMEAELSRCFDSSRVVEHVACPSGLFKLFGNGNARVLFSDGALCDYYSDDHTFRMISHRGEQFMLERSLVDQPGCPMRSHFCAILDFIHWAANKSSAAPVEYNFVGPEQLQRLNERLEEAVTGLPHQELESRLHNSSHMFERLRELDSVIDRNQQLLSQLDRH